MAAWTKTDLRNAVLVELSVIGTAETATAEDAALVEGRIDGIHAWLEGDEVAYWDVDDIPEAVQVPLVSVIADRCSKAFGLIEARRLELKNDAAMAMREIRRHTAARATCEPIRAEYF